ncbi:MAG: hypothetical protein WC243_01035 [Patescibacteria group bacterium]
MNFIEIAVFGYIILGSIYGLYVLAIGSSPWYSLPLNVIGGPIVVLYHLIRGLFYKSRNHNL